MWQKLKDIDLADTSNGVIFRTPGKWPYEEWVDFMVVESIESPSGYSILVSTGQKAGSYTSKPTRGSKGSEWPRNIFRMD